MASPPPTGAATAAATSDPTMAALLSPPTTRTPTGRPSPEPEFRIPQLQHEVTPTPLFSTSPSPPKPKRNVSADESRRDNDDRIPFPSLPDSAATVEPRGPGDDGCSQRPSTPSPHRLPETPQNGASGSAGTDMAHRISGPGSDDGVDVEPETEASSVLSSPAPSASGRTVPTVTSPPYWAGHSRGGLAASHQRHQPPDSPPAVTSGSNRGGGSSSRRSNAQQRPEVRMGGWAEEHHAARMRGSSDASVDSVPVGGITLQDNETPGAAGDPYHGGGYGWGVQGYGQQGQGQQPIGQGGTGSAVATGAGGSGSGSWARSVQLKDYVIVNGSATNIGAFVVWNVRVQTLTGNYINIRKRYSEFDEFRRRLVATFPGFEAAVPELPPKSVISKFRPRFLEKRRAGLQYFMNCILLNPQFSGSPVLKEFLFS